MTKSEVVQCPDHHFRRVMWGLAVYIADYCIISTTYSRPVMHVMRYAKSSRGKNSQTAVMRDTTGK
jgi:hypothetical protein